MSNPFLDDSFHPDWAQLTPDRIEADTTLAIELAEKNLAAIRSLASSEVAFGNVVKALEQATAGLDDCWGKVSHLDSVCNSDELRVVYNEMLPKVSAFEAKIALDPDLWSALQAFAETNEAKSLTDTDKRLFEETMDDFREAGADLSQEKRNRLEAISEELAKVTQKFSENVLDSTNAWDLIINDESKMAGLPDSAKDAARQSAKDKLEKKDDDEPCWRFTLQAPSISPVLEYLEDDSIRKEIWEAATKIGWQDDWENTDAIKQILSLRLEKASLLGKNDFADIALSRRMAKNGQKADAFVSDLRDKTAEAFSRENKELEAYK
ncbi:MAG: M3 family peptidase, partial [Opitutae bacterium]|nr:M3 family peptidase [Opitutae bacterium]